MQRITKFSALIGFLAVMTFAIGLFMFTPSFTGHSFTSGTQAAFAEVTGGGGTGCSGCGGGGFDHTGEHGGNGCTFNCNPQPAPTSCTIYASLNAVNSGDAVTISWTTSNATVATLNGVPVATGAGSHVFHPTHGTTYTLLVSGPGGTNIPCSVYVTVVPPVVEHNPVCTLEASASTISNGQSATLSWSMQNAASASIDQGIGNVSLNQNGSRVVSPTQTTNYTFTVTGNNKTVTCVKTITVTTVVNPNLSCNVFTASPSSLPQGGGNTQLSWTTTGASYVNIDQGVGNNLSVNDSKSVFVPDNRTYTLTAYDSQGHSVSCNTSATVDHGGGGGGGGGSSPSCTLFHTSTHNVSAGQKATLSWTTIRGSDLTITDNRDKEIFHTGDYDEVRSGSVDVAPTRDTVYTLVVSKQGQTNSCDVHVYTDNNVGVTTIRDRQPVTTITFRDVPYTGFDAGPILAGTFYALLAAWALVAAYVIVIQKGSVMGLSLATAGIASQMRRTAAPVVARTATAVAPFNLPVASDEDEEEEEVVEEEESNDEEESSLQNRAFAAGIILSQDALKAVVRAGSTLTERMTIIDAVLTRAKASLPREDGWIALDRSRISALFS